MSDINPTLSLDEAMRAADELLSDGGGDPSVLLDTGLDLLATLVDGVRHVTAERDRAVSSASWWEALGRDIGAKADALQAIVKGRTTPPTDKEIEAHAKVNGRWRAQTFGEFVADCMGPRMAAALRDNDREAGITRKWWATTEDGTLRAWPVVTPTDDAAREVVILCHGCGAPAEGTRPVPSTTYHTPSCRACASGMTFEPFAGGARG